MKNLGRILRPHRFSLAGLLLFVSLLGLGITQPGEFSAAATSQPAGLTSPSNTHVVAASDSRIDVSWQDNSANETGFEVHRSIDGSTGTFMLLATTAAGVTARGDLGLNPSTQYCYKVRAFITVNSLASFSDFSNTACATTLPPPPPPGLNVTGVTTGVDLDPDGYWVDVWMDSGGSRIHVTGIGLPANGTVTISGLNPADYQVELSRLAVNCDLTSPNPQPVTLGTSGSAGFAEFDVTCAPVTQLAFSSAADGNPEIYVINSNGSGSTRLTLHPAAVSDSGIHGVAQWHRYRPLWERLVRRQGHLNEQFNERLGFRRHCYWGCWTGLDTDNGGNRDEDVLKEQRVRPPRRGSVIDHVAFRWAHERNNREHEKQHGVIERPDS